MAVSITRSPASTPRPAGQHLIYTLDETTSTPDRYVVQVYKSDSTASSGTEIAKLYLVPNSAGVAHFDLSRIAEPLVEFPLSKGGTPVHAVQDAAKVFTCDEFAILRFEVRAGQYNGTTESLNQDSDYVYLLRGVEQISAGLDPSFADYYPTADTKKVWLTDRPVGSDGIVHMTMGEDDEAVALFLMTDNLGEATLASRVRWSATRTDNSTQVTSVSFSDDTNTEKNLMCVPVGPAHWSFIGLTGDIAYVDVEVIQVSPNLELSRILRITKDTAPCNHDATQLAWINSRGGWDYLRFDGRAPLTVSTTSKEYRKSVGTFGEASFTIASDVQQYDTYGKVAKEAYTLTEQFFSAEERDLLQYLMRSNVVQMRRGTGDWEPCIVRTNSLRIEPSGARFYAVSLDVELARDVRC